MRNNEEVFSIVQKIAEKEGFPIAHILSNIQYFSSKYSTSLTKKEIDNLKYKLKTKVDFKEFTQLKLTRE
jgi:hypothetical protein